MISTEIENRIENSKIHNWARINRGVEGYLRAQKVPKQYWNLFHEAIFIREEYPDRLDEDHMIEMDKKLIKLVEENGVKLNEAYTIFEVYDKLLMQWEDYQSNLQ